ncbi:MAG: PAS domain S-box protein [Candidatus Peribacteraceae bacterium]|jgi:PAS domain S-box-containing protein
MPSARKSRRPQAHRNHGGLFGYAAKKRGTDKVRKAKKRYPTPAEEWDEQLHVVAEALPQIVWTADPSGYQDYFNSRWFEYTGLTERQAYRGKTALHPRDFPVYVERWSKALKSGKAYEAKYRFRRASDGMYRWHLVRGLPLRNGKGKVVKWVGTFTDIHDIKETEEALRESERRLARTQKIARLGSWELDLVKGTLAWSDEVYRLFNLPPHTFEATYEKFLKMVHPDDRKAVDDAYTGSLREGRDTYEIEHRIVRHRTGEIRWVYEKCHHSRNADGKIVRSVGMVMDITERKKTEEEMARLASFPRLNPHPVCEVDLEGRLRYVNPAARKLFPGMLKSRLKHPWLAGLQTYTKLFRTQRTGLTTREVTVGPLWFEQTLHLVQPNCIRIYGVDITERKRVSEKVQRLNEELEKRVEERTREIEILRNRDRTTLRRLNDMINNVHVGMIATDENGVLLHVNNHYCDMFNIIDRSNLIGKHIRDLLHEVKGFYVQPEEAERTVERALRHLPVQGSEMQFKDGRIILRDYIPIFDEGVFRGNVGVFRDITRERRIDAAKSDFMSFASHQLRTPLTAIRWALGRLRRALPPEANRSKELVELVEAAHRGAKNMAETINTMLSIARIEAGTVSLTVSEVRLRSLLQQVKGTFEQECAQRNQTVIIRCPPALKIHTDLKLFSEVAVNLLSNAVKYSPEGTRITIVAHTSRKGMRLDIHDQGYGIPGHEQDRIFGKFYRGENAVRTLAEGTGLGLYLVSLLVRTLQGKVTFVSKERKGSTFTVVLPLRLPQAAPEQPAV